MQLPINLPPEGNRLVLPAFVMVCVPPFLRLEAMECVDVCKDVEGQESWPTPKRHTGGSILGLHPAGWAQWHWQNHCRVLACLLSVVVVGQAHSLSELSSDKPHFSVCLGPVLGSGT